MLLQNMHFFESNSSKAYALNVTTEAHTHLTLPDFDDMQCQDPPDFAWVLSAAARPCMGCAGKQAENPVQEVFPVQRRRADVLGAVHQHQRRGVRRRLRRLRQADQLPRCAGSADMGFRHINSAWSGAYTPCM